MLLHYCKAQLQHWTKHFTSTEEFNVTLICMVNNQIKKYFRSKCLFWKNSGKQKKYRFKVHEISIIEMGNPILCINFFSKTTSCVVSHLEFHIVKFFLLFVFYLNKDERNSLKLFFLNTPPPYNYLNSCLNNIVPRSQIFLIYNFNLLKMKYFLL